MSEYTTFLFARPSFVGGAARTLDLYGTLTEYNRSLTAEQADELAFTADLLALAQDLDAVAQAARASGSLADDA